jgi:hypothetical protein
MPLDRLKRRIRQRRLDLLRTRLAAGYVDRIVEETEKWGKVVKLSGAKLD